MKLICNDCGHVFDESEWGDHGECPSCNSTDTEEARECPICGEYHNGLIDGHVIWCCPECFQKAFNPEKFLEFATSDKKYMDTFSTLEHFILYEVFDIYCELKQSSYEFYEHCKDIYAECIKSGQILEKMKDYFDRNAMYGDFTEWLVWEHEKEAKK